MTDQRLGLPEAILLLGWGDRYGWNRSIEHLDRLLAGATIVELTLREAVVVTDGRLAVVGRPTGQPVLDAARETIGAKGKSRFLGRPYSIKTWVRRLGRRRLRAAVLDSLVEQRILRRERWFSLGPIQANRHPVVDTSRVDELRGHTADVLTRAEPVDDPWDAALGALVHAAGWRLLMRLVPHGRRLAARKRARALAKGEASVDVADAIAETNAETAAVLAACLVVAGSSSSSS